MAAVLINERVAVFQAAAQSCVIHDRSYHVPVRVSGNEDDLCCVFNALGVRLYTTPASTATRSNLLSVRRIPAPRCSQSPCSGAAHAR